MRPITKIFRWPLRQSLSVRLLFLILLFSSFFTIIVAGIQLVHDYRQDFDIIEKQMDQIQKGFSESAARNVWNFDTDGIRRQLEGLIRIQGIDYIEIFSLDNTSSAALGRIPKTGMIERRFPLEYQDDYYSRRKVGEIYVIAGLEGVYRRLWSKAILILCSQAAKTFMVSFIIILIIRYLVSRHLYSLGKYTRNLDLDRLEEPLVLKRKPAKKEKPDELDSVVAAINHMRTKLKRSARQLESKSRMEGELAAAAAIQRALLPTRAPVIKGFDLASAFFPANEVSGDYYDFIPIDDRHIAMVVADVSGKGVAAAMHANTLRILLRNRPELLHRPTELCCALNQNLNRDMPANQFLTMSYLVLDFINAEAAYVSAGHEPIVVSSLRRPRSLFLKPRGYPFCRPLADAFADRIQEERFPIHTGDMFFIYTDGLTDVTNKNGEPFGEQRLYGLVERFNKLDPQSFLNAIMGQVRIFKGDVHQPDDITMIAFKRL